MPHLASIIIPTFNRINKLKASLQTAINQSYRNIEIIVLDNSENEHVNILLNSLNDDRINLIRHPSNIGALLNIIYGICAASGEYICVLGDDDLMHSDFIASGIHLLELNTQAAGVSFAFNTFSDDTKFSCAQHDFADTIYAQKTEIIDLSNKQRKLNFCASVFRADIKEKVLDLYWSGLAFDTALLASLILEKKLIYCDTILYMYRIHNDQASRKMSVQSVDDEINVYERILKTSVITYAQKKQVKQNLCFSYITLRDILVKNNFLKSPCNLKIINMRLASLQPCNPKRLFSLVMPKRIYKFFLYLRHFINDI